MEFPQVGKQCNNINCKQLDFLPLVCKCNKQFCSEHFNQHVQTCEAVCQQFEVEPKKIEGTFRCSHQDCKETSIVPLICEKCKKHFCIKHRHIINCGDEDIALLEEAKAKYDAQVQLSNQTKAQIDKQIEDNLRVAKKKEKTKKTANKVQLMRLKGKATGLESIPSTERLYFSIQVSKEQTGRIVPIFVSKTWSLGRAIDAVATECKLQNNNNKANMKKLRLFKKDGGKSISNNLTATLNRLIEDDTLADGESLVIEYVDDGCEQI